VEGSADRRLPALDGLRGLAALVVLSSHLVMAGAPALGNSIVYGIPMPGAAGRLATSPLAIAWAGPEFVIVFFVLSGFVLTRALRDRPVPALAFLAGRALRLYLPAWASLAVGAALVALVPRSPALAPAENAGLWLFDLARPVALERLAHDVALITPSDPRKGQGTLNPVLWSLRWEVLFSLALPVVLVARRALTQLAVPVLLVAFVAVDHGIGHPALTYLPPFAVGMVLALHEPRLEAWRVELRGRGAGVAILLAACLLSADVWLDRTAPVAGPAGALVLAGATLWVLAPLLYPSVARVFTTAPMAWLGARSFSLYLVHLPVVLALAYGLGRPPFAVLAAVAVPASLLAAEAFHRAVERPSHALARAAVAQVAARRAPVGASADVVPGAGAAAAPSAG
jgi:peptidoglycan/LPS O-acetylase OafA/YrhL